MSPKARRLGVMLAFGAASAAILLLSIPVCPTALILHIPCPGCGLSRATLAALRGDFASAFKLHPAVFVVVPMITLFMLGQVAVYVNPEWTRLEKLLRARWLESTMILVMLLVIALWIARFFGAFGGPVPV